jgi:16S rRNA (guanine1207-N2)-methyltransferase
MIEAKVADIGLRLETAPGLFSPTRPDHCSLVMLSRIRFDPRDMILDLGCGYGSPLSFWVVNSGELNER